MLIIPLQAVPSQVVQVTLGGQACTLAVYTKTTPAGDERVYVDLMLENAVILSCKICQNRSLLVRYNYLGFVGDLAFVDMQGDSDPDHLHLGSRFQLVYLAPGDYVEPL